MIDRLLDQAVPPVPEPLRAAPIAAVRRRVRRRRAVRATAVGCVALIALVLGVVVALPVRNDRTGPADPAGFSWVFARVDRTGLVVTVYANPTGDQCNVLVDTQAAHSAEPDRVVVTVRGRNQREPGCSQARRAVPVPVRLAEPLGDRAVVDGSTGQSLPVYHERDLPVVPPTTEWRLVPTDFLEATGEYFLMSYTRPGGPEVVFYMTPAVGPAPSGAPDTRIVIGGRTAVLTAAYEWWRMSWRAGATDIRLDIGPDAGGPLTRDQAVAVINRLDWR
jgi:hypothetical protein